MLQDNTNVHPPFYAKNGFAISISGRIKDQLLEEDKICTYLDIKNNDYESTVYVQAYTTPKLSNTDLVFGNSSLDTTLNYTED